MRRRLHTPLPEPRMEMAPLLDVIFLLLTFFIVSWVLTVRANVLPVMLPALSTAEQAGDVRVAGITVDRTGRFFFNQQPISESELDDRLRQIGSQADPPEVFLALDVAEGELDRGPILIRMIELMRTHGIQKFNIVGNKQKPTP